MSGLLQAVASGIQNPFIRTTVVSSRSMKEDGVLRLILAHGHVDMHSPRPQLFKVAFSVGVLASVTVRSLEGNSLCVVGWHLLTGMIRDEATSNGKEEVGVKRKFWSCCHGSMGAPQSVLARVDDPLCQASRGLNGLGILISNSTSHSRLLDFHYLNIMMPPLALQQRLLYAILRSIWRNPAG
jgi:hypothetical protein